MPRIDPSYSFNSTNLRLAALTIVLFFAVIWTFSLSTSDPTLNLQLPPAHDESKTPDATLVAAPPTTEITPTAAEPDSEDPGLPPPPENSNLDNPPPAPADPAAEDEPPSSHTSEEEPAHDTNLDDQTPSPQEGDTSSPDTTDVIQPTTPETYSNSNSAQPQPPADELNPLPDPNLEQQEDDGTSNIPASPDNGANSSDDTPPKPPNRDGNGDGGGDGQGSDRTLILYAYSESDSAKENIQFFLNKALHSTSDFIFILNGNNTVAPLIPIDKPNIRIVTRENTCYDLGAFGEVLRQDDLYRQYTRFITLNASIRGPFLPVWDTKSCWRDIYLDRVTDETKLVGMTLNCKPRPHVQSMILATDQIGISAMLDPEKARAASVDDQFGNSTDLVAFAGCYAGYKQAVHAEVGTTGVIQAAGYKVDVLMTAMHSEKSPEEFCKANPDAADLLFNDAYFGSNVHPYETVFIKANRNVDVKLLNKMTEWHLKMEGNSYDTCK